MPILMVYMDKYNADIIVSSRSIEEFASDTDTRFTLTFPVDANSSSSDE